MTCQLQDEASRAKQLVAVDPSVQVSLITTDLLLILLCKQVSSITTD